MITVTIEQERPGGSVTGQKPYRLGYMEVRIGKDRVVGELLDSSDTTLDRHQFEGQLGGHAGPWWAVIAALVAAYPELDRTELRKLRSGPKRCKKGGHVLPLGKSRGSPCRQCVLERQMARHRAELERLERELNSQPAIVTARPTDAAYAARVANSAKARARVRVMS
jgi:hypothetical protein